MDQSKQEAQALHHDCQAIKDALRELVLAYANAEGLSDEHMQVALFAAWSKGVTALRIPVGIPAHAPWGMANASGVMLEGKGEG